MNFTIEFTGVDEFMQSLQGITSTISSGTSLRDAAMIVQDQMQRNALGRPGPRFVTGQLYDSIETFVYPTEAIIGPTAFYAQWVEMGHRQHPGQYVPVLRKRLVKDYAPPYPFVGPVLNQVMIQDIEMSYYDAIQEAFSISGAI